MNRKEFLQQLSLISGGVAFGMNGIPVKAFSHNPFAINLESTNGKIFVLVQLSGGNDGLNTVVPYENPLYYSKRANIAIKKENVLPLTSQMGLNPAMTAFKELYDNGKMSIVQNVGYPSPSRSHFRSTDIWLTASDANEVLDEGWVGRYLTQLYPGFPLQMPEQPMAIQLGAVESLLIQSDLGSTGVVFNDPNNFYNLVKGSTADNDPIPNTLAGEELKFMRQIATQSIAYSDIIKRKWDSAAKNVTGFPTTNLGTQLKIVGELIAGGLQTPFYLANIGGFDTHANQVVANATTTGTHANLLKTVSDAVAAFQKDMEKRGLGDKVVVMTFSEFGRRVTQNGTMGTDHGSAAPLFVIGNSVLGGLIGKNPVLSDVDSNGDIKYEFDFRQIYTSVLQDYLGLDNKMTRSVMGNKEFSTVPIFKPLPITTQAGNPDFNLEQNYPNPFIDLTRITYTVNKPMYVKLALYDLMGKELEVLREGTTQSGSYTLPINGIQWSPGYYLCSLRCDAGQKVIRLVKM
ncbi:DUF1501 domain-containing protein [Runella sp.]|uniref:DUF1501 domain-containing protein n=1 Tax=Runella sp. TaxID=1960881 RepID=UPI003D0EB620